MLKYAHSKCQYRKAKFGTFRNSLKSLMQVKQTEFNMKQQSQYK